MGFAETGKTYLRGLSYHAVTKDDGTFYYFCNSHGDVTGVVNSEKTTVAVYDYDEFGNPLERSRFGNVLTEEYNGFENNLRYAGEFLDRESENYYLRSRYYDPSIGRFTQQDTFLGVNDNPLSLNRYTYCHNNPIRFVDPSGHYSEFNQSIEGFGSIIYDADQITSPEMDEKFGRYLYLFQQGKMSSSEFFRVTSNLGVNVGIQRLYYDVSDTSMLNIQFDTAVSYDVAIKTVSTITSGNDKHKIESQLSVLSSESIKYYVVSADPPQNHNFVRADYLAAINGLQYYQGANEHGVYFTIGSGSDARSYYTGPHKSSSDIVYSTTVNGETAMYMNKDVFYDTFGIEDVFTWMSDSELGNVAYFVWDENNKTFRHQMGDPNEISNGRFKIISGTRFTDSSTNTNDVYYLGDNGKELLVFADLSSAPINIMYAKPSELTAYLEKNAYGQDTVAGRAIAAYTASGTLPDSFDEGHYAYDYIMYRTAILSEWNVVGYRANPTMEDSKNALFIAIGATFGQKYSLKKISSNKRANEIAKELGYKNAEDFKDIHTMGNGAQYNIKYDSKTREIVLEGVRDSRKQIATGEFMP